MMVNHNLPTQLIPLVGREGEMRTLRQLLHRPDLRLVTITGRIVADKQRMRISVLGSTDKVVVPRFPRAQTSLNDEQVIEMAQLAPRF
jgi:hypothetical protein